MINKLTDRKINAIKATEKEQNIGDGGGLWLRVQSRKNGGGRSFYIRCNYGGKAKRFSIGQYPAISLAKAREERDRAKEALAMGRDPAVFSRTTVGVGTVRGLADTWQKTVLSTHADGGAKIIGHFEHDIFPFIGDQPASTVTHDQIVTLIEAIVQRGAKVKASKVLSWLRAMYAFGIRRRIVQADPTAGLRAKDVGAGEFARSRNLSWLEIEELGKKIPKAGLPRRIEAALWALLATGCRPGELRLAKTEHTDLQKREWWLPETKNNTEHVIHLSDFAVKQFTVLLEYSEHGWLLAGRRPGKPVSDSFLRKLIGDRISTVHRSKTTQYFGTLRLSNGPWRLHDLRRTMASRMGDLGVSPHVIEACLNHMPPGIRAVYQRQEYLTERQQAFDQWGQALASRTQG
jgi:integrase